MCRILQYEKYKKVANFNVMINAPKLSAMEFHTDIIHLHFLAEGNGKGLLLVLALELVQGRNNQKKHQMSKKEKLFKNSKHINHKGKTTQLSTASMFKFSSVCWRHCILIWAPFVACDTSK